MQTTILPADLGRIEHGTGRAASDGAVGGVVAALQRELVRRGQAGERHDAGVLRPGSSAWTDSPALVDGPLKVAPLPSVTIATVKRSCVDAATVVTHGLMCDTVLPGPLLPAEAATNTPAAAALKKAISIGSTKLVRVPLIE